MTEDWIEDGFGSAWQQCGPGCGLEVVRPGKVQCVCDGDPSCRATPQPINMDDVKAAEKYRELRVRDVKCPTCEAFSQTRCRIAGERSEVSHRDRYLLAAGYGIVPPLKGF